MTKHNTKAVISVWPYYGPSLNGGWLVNINDPSTGESWQRLFYYKTDAKQLKHNLEGKTLEEIFDIYGTGHFTRVL